MEEMEKHYLLVWIREKMKILSVPWRNWELEGM